MDNTWNIKCNFERPATKCVQRRFERITIGLLPVCRIIVYFCLYVCMYVCMVNRVWINRVRLPILLVVN